MLPDGLRDGAWPCARRRPAAGHQRDAAVAGLSRSGADQRAALLPLHGWSTAWFAPARRRRLADAALAGGFVRRVQPGARAGRRTGLVGRLRFAPTAR